MPAKPPIAPAPVDVAAGKAPGPSRTDAASVPHEQSFPVGVLVHASNVLRELGQDPWDLLESFGVTQAVMARPMTPIPLAIHGQILQAAADATAREDFGLLVGQRATLEHAGPLRLLVFNARTTREAVESLVRYQGLWYHGLNLDMTANRGFTCLSISIESRFPGRDQVLTGYLAALVRHLEGILPRNWRPSQVHISYRRPRMAEQYARFFRAPVLYDQARHAVFFAESALNASRQGSEQMLDTFLREYMGELEAREHPDFVSRVRSVIESLLASGDCSVVRVAGMFAIHRVTLHRYLRDQQTTFETLLDDARRSLASRMLEQTDLPVGEIAVALGYSASASFVRAYRRWYGVTPGAGRSRRPALGRAASTAHPVSTRN